MSGTALKVKAFPSPDVTWPASTPTWRTVGDSWFSSRISSSAAEEKTVDTSGTEEEFDIVAMCGTHEAKITVTIFTVEVTHMVFYGSSPDCYSLKASSTGANINIPEVTPAGGDKKVLFGANKNISVKVRMITDPSVTISGVKVKSDVTGYDISELSETSVSFSNGVSCGSSIGSTNGFVIFNAKNKSKNSIGKDIASFAWKFIGESNYTLSSPKSLNTISEVTIYTILDAPKGPWSGNPAWINALDFAIITCGANGKGADAAMAQITTVLRGITYPFNGDGVCFVGQNFSYTTYMNRNLANCYDQAMGLSTTFRLIGINATPIEKSQFFGYDFHCFVVVNSSGIDYVYDSTHGMTHDGLIPIKIPKSDFVARGNPGLGSVERILDYSIQ